MSRTRVESDAIVLTSSEVRDDRILHLLTPEHGRLPVVAKRARKAPKRFGGHLQPMTLLAARITMKAGREIAYLDGCSEAATFSRVKGDLERFAYASVMVEVVTHLIPPHGHEVGVFELLLRALTHLDSSDEVDEALVALFELRMLRGLGFLPAWEDMPQLPVEVIPVLEAWLQSEWRALPEGSLFATINVLEGLIQHASGRALKSRAVLSDLLGR